MMASKSRFWTYYDSSNESENTRLISEINASSDTHHSKRRKQQLKFEKIRQAEGLNINFPHISDQISSPDFRDYCNRVEKQQPFTPAPIVFNSASDKAIWRMVKKFSNKYELIWILITSSDHPATKNFTQIYEAQKLSNVNKNLQNMVTPKDCTRVSAFTKEGLVVKIMADFESFHSRQMLQYKNALMQDHKVLQIYVEKDRNSNMSVVTRKKVKGVQDLTVFIQQQVKLDVENSRKDKPYYNFIHNNSGPELFNRRSIIKNCLSHKLKNQFLQNHESFINLMMKNNRQQRQKRDLQINKKIKTFNTEKQLQQSALRYEDHLKKIQYFSKQFGYRVQKFYPLEQMNDVIKKQTYDWVIIQYCIESALYPAVNNTIRFASNNESSKPISTYVKYLYDALRFYFTTKYKQITYEEVYRGSRISLAEQRSFIEKRCIWNLGFMSTSRSQKVADGFLNNYKDKGYDQSQLVKIKIILPKVVKQIQYLWNQEGFFSLDKIPEIQKYINVREQQVLFNPLNVFEIVKWQTDSKGNKILILKYGPHLQILEKQRNRIPITEDDRNLMRNITKLKDGGFDKGQQLLQEGDPSEAVKYYEQSHETGSSLSFTQKSYYIKGLMQVGSISKMQSMLKDSLAEEEEARKQLKDSISNYSFEKIIDSVQSITICQATTNFILADDKAKKTVQSSSKRSEDAPTQQSLLLQVKSYIELAKIKFSLSETFDSIRQSIRSLKIIDQLAHLNFCYRIWDVCNDLRSIGQFRSETNLQYLNVILEDKNLMSLNIAGQKQTVLKNIAKVRQWKISYNDIVSNPLSNSYEKSNAVKRAHKQAQNILNVYFNQRDRRTDLQKFEQNFIKAYWDVQRARIGGNNISEKQEIQLKWKLKNCQQKMFDIKNDYKQLFEHEVEAYQVLYRNIYKTSIDVTSCLESYHRNLYRRYEDFVTIESQNAGQSLDLVEVLWKHSEILYDYGQIIQRPKKPQKLRNQKTQAEINAELKMKSAEQTLQRIQKRKGRITQSRKVHYTYEKSEIRRTLSKYFKSKAIDKRKARKISVNSSLNADQKQSYLSDSQMSDKVTLFNSLISIIEENRAICESDSDINKPLYLVKNACDKIQAMNQSENILLKGDSYSKRLISCKSEYEDVILTIQRSQQKQIMERNVNMAHLYYLMGENQYRLGIISKSRKFLQQAVECLQKSLKLDEGYIENTKINRQKLLLGNETYVGCLRIQSCIAAYYGSLQQKKNIIEELRKKKEVMFSTMNEPINEADMNQSIGLVLNNILLMHKEVDCRFEDVQKYYVQAIEIRKVYFGPFNKYNAFDYTLLANLISENRVKQKYAVQIKKCYDQATKIFERIDMSVDSTLILYKMQLQSTNCIYNFKGQLACQIMLKYLEQYGKYENKRYTLEAGKQLYRCCIYLLSQPKYEDQGLRWLKYTCQYIIKLEELVSNLYDIKDGDKNKEHISQLKFEILQKIIKTQYVKKNKQVSKEYNTLYENEKIKRKQEKLRSTNR